MGWSSRVGGLLVRLIGISDEPADDDDTRVRRRVGAASTRELLGDTYRFDRREVEVKGLGLLTTYLVEE
jgi:hypothetical protein